MYDKSSGRYLEKGYGLLIFQWSDMDTFHAVSWDLCSFPFFFLFYFVRLNPFVECSAVIYVVRYEYQALKVYHHPSQQFSARHFFDIVTLDDLGLKTWSPKAFTGTYIEVPLTGFMVAFTHFHSIWLDCATKASMAKHQAFLLWLDLRCHGWPWGELHWVSSINCPGQSNAVWIS